MEADLGPTPLRWAVLLLWLEAAAVASLAVVELAKVATGRPSNPGYAVVLGLMILGVGAILAKAGHALTHARGWAHSVALVLQLCTLPVAWFMATGEGGLITKAVGVLLGAVCFMTSALLLAPTSRAALR